MQTWSASFETLPWWCSGLTLETLAAYLNADQFNNGPIIWDCQNPFSVRACKKRSRKSCRPPRTRVQAWLSGSKGAYDAYWACIYRNIRNPHLKESAEQISARACCKLKHTTCASFEKWARSSAGSSKRHEPSSCRSAESTRLLSVR